MGSYADPVDIQAEFKSIDFANDQSITTVKVNEFIDQEEALIEGRLATIYAIPITGVKPIAIVKKITIMLVRARVLDILHVKTGQKDESQETTAQGLRDQANAILDMIMNKTILLTASTSANSAVGVKSYNSSNDIEQKVKRDTDQW